MSSLNLATLIQPTKASTRAVKAQRPNLRVTPQASRNCSTGYTRKASDLIVLQGLDAAGKDGVIRHVISGTNPQGVNVTCFKQPTDEELPLARPQSYAG
jgi:polyphosphate kinase 2 (PPK2 family)